MIKIFFFPRIPDPKSCNFFFISCNLSNDNGYESFDFGYTGEATLAKKMQGFSDGSKYI